MDSILLINKEEGLSSFQAIAKVRRQLNLKKIGHAGTLDPFATGLLIACINRATKTASLFQELPKTYEATFVFGESKDTDDLTGQTLKTCSKIPTLKEIKEAIPLFTGEIEQMPPQYSALKVNGKRAYKLAREGKEVALKARKRFVYEYLILNYDNNELKVQISCSSGTYIRSLARDLGEKLNSLAYVKNLIRTQIGNFKSSNSILISEISEKNLIPLNSALSFLEHKTIKNEYLKLVKNGQPMREEFLIDPPVNKEQAIVLQDETHNLVGVLKGDKYIYLSL